MPAINLSVGLAGGRPVEFDKRIMEMMIEQLREYAPDMAQQITAKEIQKAAKIGLAALESEVRQIGQVTGNLLRAVATKNKVYKNNPQKIPVPVSIVGFRRSGTGDTKKSAGSKIKIGNDRAFHSHLVEFGTKRRMPGKSTVVRRSRRIVAGRKVTQAIRRKDVVNQRSVVMSSIETTWEFGNQFIVRVNPTVGLGRMPALAPVENAFNASKSDMQSTLMAGIEKAADEAFLKFKKRLP